MHCQICIRYDKGMGLEIMYSDGINQIYVQCGFIEIMGGKGENVMFHDYFRVSMSNR